MEKTAEVCGIAPTTLFYIVSWFVANVTTIILNKYIFQIMEFVYPTTLTLVHMVTCTLGTGLILRVLRPHMFVKLDWEEYFRGVVPLAGLFCVNIVLGNISLRFVPASFMQTIKSSVPFFIVLIDKFIFNNTAPDPRIYYSLAPIVGGVMLASWTEANFELTGFLAALVASVVTAAQANVSAKLMKTKMDSVNLLYYMAPLSAGLLLPFAAFWEFGAIAESWDNFSSQGIHIVLFISGVIALSLSTLDVLTFLVISNTSALTYTVIGNVKVIFSIVFSVLMFKNEIGIFNGIGCAVTVFGAWWYSHIQYEIRTKKVAPPPTEIKSSDK